MTTSGGTVLIVDDERTLARAVKAFLGEARDQLGFSLRQVERQPVGLRESGDQEDEKREEEREHVPEPQLLFVNDGREAYRRRFSDVDLLLVDDVQFLTHRREMQAELLRLSDALQTTNRQSRRMALMVAQIGDCARVQ